MSDLNDFKKHLRLHNNVFSTQTFSTASNDNSSNLLIAVSSALKRKSLVDKNNITVKETNNTIDTFKEMLKLNLITLAKNWLGIIKQELIETKSKNF